MRDCCPRIISKALFLLLLASCGQTPELVRLPPVPSPIPSASLERSIHDRVNRHRQSTGRAPLTWDPTLAALAAEHSVRMANGTRPFGHDGFDERVASARANVSASRFSENVASNNYPAAMVAQQVVDGWIGSPGHRRNLEGAFQITGVGVARSSSGDYFVTQIYAGE